MTDIANILEKVRKLRALAAGASNFAEAQAAIAQAEAIIARYQLDEAQIGLDDGSGASEGMGIATEPLYVSGGKNNETWRSQLAGVLSKHYGCYYYRSRDLQENAVIKLVGRPSDVELVRYMYAWLTVELDRLAQSESGKSARNGFRLGATYGVKETLEASRTSATKSSQSGAALVLVGRSDKAAALAHRLLKLNCTPAPRIADGGAYLRGKTAGKRVHLGPVLGSGSAHRRLS